MKRQSIKQRIRLKYLAHIEMGQSPPSTQYSSSPEDGLPFLQGTADFGSISPTPRVYCGSPTKLAQAGDILLSVRAPVGELNTADQDYGIGRGLCAIRTKSHWNGCFAWWALHEARHQLNFVATGSTYEAVATEDVGNLLVEAVGLKEQRGIAEYLDRETARIDAMIAAKERLLGLLAEKRRALITRAVTRGLDPSVPLRDSGILCLGEIPAHWEVRMLRFACDAIETGATPSADFLDDKSDDGINWFTPGDFGEGIRLLQSARKVSAEALNRRELKMFPAGSVLVVGIGATLGKIGFIEEQASANQQINALIPRKQVDTRYLANLLTVLTALMVASANSATLPILNQQRMGELRVLVPPIQEQVDIVSTLAVATIRIDRLTAAIGRTITLLKDRRSALIAAAVTGQIDVGGDP